MALPDVGPGLGNTTQRAIIKAIEDLQKEVEALTKEVRALKTKNTNKKGE